MFISEIAKNLGSRDLMRPFDANICVSMAANELLNALKASGLSIYPIGQKFIFCDGKKYSGLSRRGFEDTILMASEAIGVNRIFVRSDKFIKSVRKYISTINFDDYFPKKEKVSLIIGFSNAVIEIKRGGKLKVSRPSAGIRPDYFLPGKYTKRADCPIFQQYLSQALPDKEKTKVLQEFLGLCLVPQWSDVDPNAQKALFLVGPSSSGKSVLNFVFSKAFGEENVSVVMLSQLTDPQTFLRAQIDGKLVNITSDAEDSIKSPTVFKSLVSGEKLVSDRKYKDSVDLSRPPRIISIGNKFPRCHTFDGAVLRRIIYVEFINVVPKEIQNPYLARNIIEEEQSGILNWLLSGLSRFLQNNSFSADLTPRIEQVDPVAAFMKSEKYIKSNKYSVPLRDLFSEFLSNPVSSAWDGFDSRPFSRRLTELGYGRHLRGNAVYINVEKGTPKSDQKEEKGECPSCENTNPSR